MKNHKLIVLCILFTSNNIIYSVSDVSGKVLFWTSFGSWKVKGSKKINNIFLISTLKVIKNFINKLNYKFIFVKVKGFNKSKKFMLKTLKQMFSNTFLVHDKTSYPHNGCKGLKKRRV